MDKKMHRETERNERGPALPSLSLWVKASCTHADDNRRFAESLQWYWSHYRTIHSTEKLYQLFKAEEPVCCIGILSCCVNDTAEVKLGVWRCTGIRTAWCPLVAGHQPCPHHCLSSTQSWLYVAIPLVLSYWHRWDNYRYSYLAGKMAGVFMLYC